MGNIIIDVQNVSKVYKMYDKPTDRLRESIHPFRKKYHKEFYALNNVSFQVKEGETLGLIGRNGAGKSTLLKLITGVLTPTQGQIKVNGKVSALLELGAGFNPELSGIENVYFNGMIMGYSREEMESKIDDILSFADIGEHIYQPVKTYSSGMFVRLAFSVAVLVNPEILIIDEALAVGDVRFRQKAIRKMKELMSVAKAILFVTHDMESIKNFCTDVIWLKDGSIFERGNPKDTIQRYYNFMTNDILPIQHDNQKSKPQKINKDDLNVSWDSVEGCELVGGNDVDVERVAFFNKETLEKIDILTGEEKKLQFLADIKINKDVIDPIIGFGIFNQYGVPVVHFNSSSIKNSNMDQLKMGDNVIISVSFNIPRLQNGTYSVSFGINDGTLDSNFIVQHIRDCYVFRVIQNGVESRQYGMILVDDAEISLNNSVERELVL